MDGIELFGTELIDTFLAATGLPEDRVRNELFDLIQEHNINPENLTLQQLRELMVEYLQKEILKAKAAYSGQA